ncbi:MAG: dTDP-4-dehydrorhamnose 3,5-epimerase family protein [Planctomycetota bacterium]
MKQFKDGRGWFCENIRQTEPLFVFGQWSGSMMWTGVIKAWHLHQIQTDYWRIPVGVVRAVMCDMRPESPTYKEINEHMMGQDYEPIILTIPPGVAHGCKVLQGPAYLDYITSHVYNPDDEYRLPHDTSAIGYDWLAEEIT